MSFTFANPKPRRRPSLTPMIDVVFLLLVFFMLAARFGQDGAIPLGVGQAGSASWDGPPRLVDIGASDLRLNGRTIAQTALDASLMSLVEQQTDPILLRPDGEADLQRLLDVMAQLEGAGFTSLVLIEP